MNLELVIRASERDVKIALLQDKVLVELHNEQGSNDFSVGDVYLGKVHRVLPSLNAAFVDVGYEKDAFLHYLDLGPQFRSLNKYLKRVQAGKQTAADLEGFECDPDIDKNGKINDVVSGSQNILVQVAKEPISSKGPRLTSEITLAGRYLVLVPFSDKISLSQRLSSNEERTRLRRLISSIKPKNMGVIVRTQAEGRRVAELDADLQDLLARWNKIFDNLQQASPPKRVLGELNKTSSLLRDLLNNDFTSITVNDEGLYEQIKSYVQKSAPQLEEIIKLYKGKIDIFENFGIHRQIKGAFGRQINLKSGAYLVIEHTEAMHVIDVNSGSRKSSEKNQEQNALETNLECAKEIARLLRLRDMGGIICVDFIDMNDKAHQRQLYEKLKEYLAEDKTKHNVLPPSKFGVVEITRQRVREVTDITTEEKCPCCQGTGQVQASILLTEQIENQLHYIMTELKPRQVSLRVHPFVEAYLNKGLVSKRLKWTLAYRKPIQVKADSSYGYMEYHFTDHEGAEIPVG